MDKIKTFNEILFEHGIDTGSLNDDFNTQLFHAGERYAEQQVALSTQSPKWVKASERLPEKDGNYFIKRGSEYCVTTYDKGIGFGIQSLDIQWLDDEPPSTHPLQEKIDGLRDALSVLLVNLDEIRVLGTWCGDVDNAVLKAKQALETYK